MSPELPPITKNPVRTEIMATTINGLPAVNPKTTTLINARIKANFNVRKGLNLSIKRPIIIVATKEPKLIHAKAMLNCRTEAPLWRSKEVAQVSRNHNKKKLRKKSIHNSTVVNARPPVNRCLTGIPGKLFLT